MFRSELISVVFCCTDEDQISHMKSVCLDVFVSSLHIPVLVFAENRGDVIPVSQKTSSEWPGLVLYSFLGPRELPEVVVENMVVSVREVIRGKVGFHQGALFTAISTMPRTSSPFLSLYCATRRSCLMVPFILSVRPLVWGSKALEGRS